MQSMRKSHYGVAFMPRVRGAQDLSHSQGRVICQTQAMRHLILQSPVPLSSKGGGVCIWQAFMIGAHCSRMAGHLQGLELLLQACGSLVCCSTG